MYSILKFPQEIILCFFLFDSLSLRPLTSKEERYVMYEGGREDVYMYVYVGGVYGSSLSSYTSGTYYIKWKEKEMKNVQRL